MPFTNNQGIRIHYEIIGEGPPIVLVYGQYFPLEIWHELNYVDALKYDYRLILVDARGQGESAKPYDPEAYRIELMVKDIVSIMDDLGFEKIHYMGYSSSGDLGYGMAMLVPERCSSLIIGGAHPYDTREASVNSYDERIQTLEKQDTADFVAGIEEFLISLNLPPLSQKMRIRMLMHDTRALAAWLKQYAEWQSFEHILGEISVPCLLYAGEKSGEYFNVERAAQEIPGATFVSIPNGGHLEGGTWINILKPHIDRIVKKEITHEHIINE